MRAKRRIQKKTEVGQSIIASLKEISAGQRGKRKLKVTETVAAAAKRWERAA